MSKQLAPIHEGLYKKIILFENIEKLIVQKTERQQGHQILTSKFGDFLPQTALSDIIDHNNIHGWLQDAIDTSEKRQAALIYALMNEGASLLEKVKEAYYEVGHETGQFFTANQVADVYKHINTVLLDGMPCDKVNKLVEQADNLIQWQTVHCVHERNWNNQGVDLKLYYQFRTAFLKGFIDNLGKNFIYKFSEDFLLHEIKKI